jgi:hypothetical protein
VESDTARQAAEQLRLVHRALERLRTDPPARTAAIWAVAVAELAPDRQTIRVSSPTRRGGRALVVTIGPGWAGEHYPPYGTPFVEALWFVLTGGPLESAGPWPEGLTPLKAAAWGLQSDGGPTMPDRDPAGYLDSLAGDLFLGAEAEGKLRSVSRVVRGLVADRGRIKAERNRARDAILALIRGLDPDWLETPAGRSALRAATEALAPLGPARRDDDAN